MTFKTFRTAKTLVVAAAFLAAPGFAFAHCSSDHARQTMSCAEGTQWDQATATCVPVTTS